MVEAMGGQGLGWEGEEFSPAELIATHGWLRSKGNSIEGGTSEVNVNVVAKRVLGLPGDIRVDKDVPFNKIPTKGRT